MRGPAPPRGCAVVYSAPGGRCPFDLHAPQYYPADCYAEGINRRARILTRLLDMCAAGAKEALIPLPLPLPTS
jgi:hypothetical protein